VVRSVRAVFLAMVCVSLVTPVPARAATTLDFAVTSMSPFVGTGLPLKMAVTVRNLGDAPVEGAALRFTLHDRVRTRSALRQALDGEPRTDVLAVTTEQLEEPLQPGERRVVNVERDLGTLASPFRRPQDGVYPLTIQLRVSGETVDEAGTAIPFFFEQPSSKLNVVAVLPIHVPAAFDAGGAYQVGGLDRAVQRNGRVDVLLSALASQPALALTIAPTALTLDQLDDLGNGFTARDAGGTHEVRADDPIAVAARSMLDRMRQIAGSPAVQTVSSTYARADVLGLAHNGMTQDLREQFDEERSHDSLLLGREPVPGVFAPPGYALDARSAVEIARQGAQTVILAPESLPERDTRFGYDRPETVTGGGGVRLTALVVDPSIRDRLASKQRPVLDAQGALAETAASYFELPALAAERLIVVATPGTPDPAVARTLVAGLATAPWIQLRTAGEAAAALEPSEEPIPLPLQRTPDRVPLSAARAASRVVATLGAVVEDTTSIASLQRFILASESADWIEEPARGSILARAARGSAERQLALIRVAARQVTLTSRSAREFPVTILNDTGGAIRIRIALDSGKITFPDGATRDLEVVSRVETVTFRAETRVTGSFPLTVRILTPDGKATVGEGQIVVRSTAVSAFTLLVIGGGMLVLLASWGRRSLKMRRRQAASAA
jgi:hypothetical protein